MAEPATAGRVAPARQGHPRVIYVMGAGRSGSTILGVTLGNCEGVFYAGELDAWLAQSGRPLLDDPERVEFWDRVRAQVPGAEQLFGREAERALERSLSLLRVHKWGARRRLREPYRRVARSLYEAISAQADGAVVVDTSHYPLRARQLQATAGVDLYLVYLMRDPHSVVASFNRNDVQQYTKSTLTTNVYLWLTNLLAILAFLRHPRERRLFVRYEDFLANPAGVLAEIVGLAGLSPPPPDFTYLRTGIPLLGNRLIRRETVSLEGAPSGPARRSSITALLQYPWTATLARLRPRAGHAER